MQNGYFIRRLRSKFDKKWSLMIPSTLNRMLNYLVIFGWLELNVLPTQIRLFFTFKNIMQTDTKMKFISFLSADFLISSPSLTTLLYIVYI